MFNAKAATSWQFPRQLLDGNGLTVGRLGEVLIWPSNFPNREQFDRELIVCVAEIQHNFPVRFSGGLAALQLDSGHSDR